MGYEAAISELGRIPNRNPKEIECMRRFGISVDNGFIISIMDQKKFAKKIGKEHELAQRLYDSGIHEARTIAALIDSRQQDGLRQMR